MTRRCQSARPANAQANRNSGQGWAGQIYPYIKNLNVFTCPSDPFTLVGAGGGNASNVTCSYSLNQNVNSGGGNTFKFITIPQMHSPASTVYLFEITGGRIILSNGIIPPTENTSPAGLGCSGCGINGTFPGFGRYATGQMGGFINSLVIPGRHNDGSNFVFCDGHAKWFKGEAVSPGRNAPNNSAPAFAPGGAGNAAGTGNMTGPGGIRFAATFSLE